MMKPTTIFLSASLLIIPAIGQVTFGGALFASVGIPDGAAPCVAGTAATVTITVPSGFGLASSVTATVGVTHTYCSDLRITLTSPCGTTVRLLSSSCDDGTNVSNDLGGNYTFDDAAPHGIDGTAALLGGAAVPAGTYWSDEILSRTLFGGVGGDWTFTFEDGYPTDIGWVSYVAVTLTSGIPTSPVPMFTVCQHAAGAPLVIAHAGGFAGDIYFNPVVIGAGHATGSGWFFGLDVSFLEVVSQAGWAPIFIGALDTGGRHVLSIPSVPPGITFGTVGLLINPATGTPWTTSEPLEYTTR